MGIICLLLFWLMMTRAGVLISFGPEGFSLRILFGVFSKRILPDKKKRQEPDKPENLKTACRPSDIPAEQTLQETEPEQKKKKDKDSGLIKSYDTGKLIPIGLEAVGRFSRILRFDKIELRIIAAADAPDKAAILYGRVCAALGAGLPFIHRWFRVKRQNISADISFQSSKIEAAGQVKVTVRIGSTLCFIIWGLVRVLRSGALKFS